MTGATATASAKKKRRRMKQMEGLLLISRPKADDGAARVLKPKKVHVMLQPQQLQLSYSAQEDQDMKELLGRIDLDGAKLEQAPDGFVIHADEQGKIFKLHDKDKATLDAWFYAVYATITEFMRTPIETTAPAEALQFSAVLSSSLRDEATDVLEFELSCQVVVPSRDLDEPSLRWTVWRTAAEIQALDDDLRAVQPIARQVVLAGFPRERKRDSLFGGLRRKFVQELREQQLSVYIEKLFRIGEVSSDPDAQAVVRGFLQFDTFFELKSIVDDLEENPTSPEESAPQSRFEQADQYQSQQLEHANYLDEYSATLHRSSSPHVSFSTAEAHVSSYDHLHEEPPQPLSRPGTSQFDDDHFLDEIVEIEPETDPIAAKKLHKQIIRMVREVVGGDEDRVREFQDQTKDFGRDRCAASEYCAFLQGALGGTKCCELIPMMARLLPDEEKRQALLDARSTILRKKLRRNRRRSKQFSESVVMQQQRQSQDRSEWPVAHKIRPKSDSLAALAQSARVESFPVLGRRSSMAELQRTAASAPAPVSDNQANELEGRKSLPDVRRKFESRPSFNLFGETIPTAAIEEESGASIESSDDNNQDFIQHNEGDHLDKYGHFREQPLSPEPAVKSLPPVFRRAGSLGSNSWLQQAPRSAASAQLSYGQRARPEKSHFDVAHHEKHDHTSETLEPGAVVEHQPAAEEEEENPVLARLRKQGAVNFMLR